MTQPQPNQRRDHLEPPATRNERAIYMVYPDTFWVAESKLRVWLSDCIANDELYGPAIDPATADFEDVVEALQDTGKFTFQDYRA